jgi:hypothetical protein
MDQPFSLKKISLRKSFQPYFLNEKWLNSALKSFVFPYDFADCANYKEDTCCPGCYKGRNKEEEFICDLHKNYKKIVPASGKPFIRGLGQVSIRTKDNIFKQSLIDYMNSIERQDNNIKPLSTNSIINDQRMLHLWLELDQPLFIKALFKEKSQAQGKIYIHIYPSGYVSILISINLIPFKLYTVNEVGDAILKTYPWRKHNEWKWKSKLGEGTLEDITNIVKTRLFSSLFENNKYPRAADNFWNTSISIVSDNNADELSSAILGSNYIKKEFKLLKPFFFNNHQLIRIKDIYFSKQGLICRFSSNHNKNNSQYFFWNINQIIEFVRLKDQIYKDYLEFLRPEIVKLRSYRLNKIDKFCKENLNKFSVFNPKLSVYMLSLDSCIRSSLPTYRYIYSIISNETGFSNRRKQLKELLTEWEAEVAEWEHGITLIWKRIFSPLLKLLIKN